MKKLNILIICSTLSLMITTAHSTTYELTQTKTQLKQLENKMSQLQQTIHLTQNKQIALSQALTHTDQDIRNHSLALKKIQNDLLDKQKQIAILEQQVNSTSKQLHKLQVILAQHIRSRYTLNHNPPLGWLLNQDKPTAIHRLFIFHQYLIRSRKEVMDKVIETKDQLASKQDQLQQEMNQQAILQKQLNQRLIVLTREKQKRTTLIQSMTQDIHQQKNTLETYQQNKNNLSRLLQELAQKSVIQTRRPFAQMRKKLSNPVSINQHGKERINQGVVYYADEGNSVNAVFPGKIVFSDWLNGYGLLLIIDHGRGYMTLYGNNKTLIKHKGDVVNQDEKIAKIGHTGTLKKNGLYFEIRYRGKAINPLEWMS